MPENALTRHLNDFVTRLRPLLGTGIVLRLHVADGCPERAALDEEPLEATLLEMVRRLMAAMPVRGEIDIRARSAGLSPEVAQACLGTPGRDWVALSVSSPQADIAGVVDAAHRPRIDLARSARRWGGGLSVLALEPHGTEFALHLCEGAASGSSRAPGTATHSG